MRVVVVHPLGLEFIGQYYIHLMARELAKKGVEMMVVSPRRQGDRLTDGSLPSFRWVPAEFERGWLARSVKRQVTDFAPDIVHVWTPRSMPSRVGVELVAATSARLIVNYEDPEYYHFDLTGGPTKGSADLLALESATLTADQLDQYLPTVNWHWVLQTLPDPFAYEYLHPVFFPLVNQLADGFTGIWHTWVERLRRSYQKPTLFMPLAVDFADYPPDRPSTREAVLRKLQLPNDALLYLRSGVVYRDVNDLDVTLYAFAELVRSHPHAYLILSGYNYHAERTKKLIESLKLESNIRSVGWLSWQEYRELEDAIDVALCPGQANDYNRYRLPGKIVGYMAAGKPIICMRAGIGETLVDGVDALTHQEFTPAVLTGQMRMLAESPQLRATLAAHCRQKAQEWFDVHTVTQRMAEFYSTIVSPPVVEATTPPAAEAYEQAARLKLATAMLKVLPKLAGQGGANLLIYGGGMHTRRLLELTDLAPMQIVAIVDDAPKLASIGGHPVVTPEATHDLKYDAVLISSDTVEEMLFQRAQTWRQPDSKVFRLYS